MDEIDIWRTATVLIRQHGNDAWAAAGQRADELRAKGDAIGCAICIKIGQAVETLNRQKPREGEAVN